ncbi:MAG: hypothetical protein Q9220_005872 [cf. Caloplaca sp. 1 TL-2023]
MPSSTTTPIPTPPSSISSSQSIPSTPPNKTNPTDTTLPKDPLFSTLLETATQFGGDRAIVDDCSRSVKFGYRHILQGVVELRERLKGVLEKEKGFEEAGTLYIALLAPNGYEFVVGVLAVLAVGGVVVPMPTGALPSEAAHILRQCSACCLLVGPEQVELAARIRDGEGVKIPALEIESYVIGSADNDKLFPLSNYTLDPSTAVSEECPSILFFTSGTTGPPKGVLHARRSINKYAHQKPPVTATTDNADDEICLIPRKAFWSIYFTKLFQMLLLGIKIEIQDFGRDYARIWEKFRERTGTKIVLSPTFWHGMMKHFEERIAKVPDPDVVREYVDGFRYLRDVGITGAMPTGRLLAFWRGLRGEGGRPMKVQYGTTETQEISVWEVVEGMSEADLGTPFPNVEMKLSEGDEGEVLVKTPSLFLGYLNCPEDTAERFDSEGFFKTGDLAIRHNGRLIFKGRANMDTLNAVFKFYTYKVPRLYVETHLLALPYVAEGYIMPVEDPQCDTRVAALVRFHNNGGPDDKKLDLRTLREDLANDMPAYQLPTVLRVLRDGETVPRTWSDKTAMMKAVHMFFPQDSEDRLCGEATEVWDISQFMRAETTKMWDLSGMR